MRPPLGIACRLCGEPMPAADLLESSSRTVCRRCYEENQTVQAEMVRELDLFATSTEPTLRKLRAAARGIGGDAIRRQHYRAADAFEIVELVARDVPRLYMRENGVTDYVPTETLSPAVIGELAYGLLHDWVIPYIREEILSDLERIHRGRLPKDFP